MDLEKQPSQQAAMIDDWNSRFEVAFADMVAKGQQPPGGKTGKVRPHWVAIFTSLFSAHRSVHRRSVRMCTRLK